MDLLDEIIPAWHYGNHHQIVVDAPIERVVDALETLPYGRDASWLVQLFFRVRGLKVPSGPTPREALTATGFSVIGERPGREIVLGIAGRFWAPREMANLVQVPDAEAFRRFAKPGQAKGALQLRADPLDDGRTLLGTETRVWCSDRRARLLFGLYWTLIRIPSGIIRGDMLRAIARRATAREKEAVA
jgi:hypothetical protein